MEPKTQSLITSINTNNITGVLNGLQSTIDKVVSESIPVSVLINQGAKEPLVVASIAVIVTKYANMLSVGGNVKAGQEIEIAKMLVEEYPTLSLDDFNLLLSHGVRGRYGEIFRFDVAVIFGWAGQYLEEWAEEKERQLAKQKQKLIDELEKPIDYTPDTEKMINDFLNTLKESKGGMRSVPTLTKQEIKMEGKSEPPPKKATAFDIDEQRKREQLIMHSKKIEYGRLFSDPTSHEGRLIPGSPSFDEWLLMDK